VRWLRPDFQNPGGVGVEQESPAGEQPAGTPAVPDGRPKGLPAPFQAVREVLADQPTPADAEQIARQFRRARTTQVAELLETLAALGQVQQPEPERFAA
jgi:hypothetical protein